MQVTRQQAIFISLHEKNETEQNRRHYQKQVQFAIFNGLNMKILIPANACNCNCRFFSFLLQNCMKTKMTKTPRRKCNNLLLRPKKRRKTENYVNALCNIYMYGEASETECAMKMMHNAIEINTLNRQSTSSSLSVHFCHYHFGLQTGIVIYFVAVVKMHNGNFCTTQQKNLENFLRFLLSSDDISKKSG